MKASIKISSNYGFDHSWTLELETKDESRSIYLGQDVKVCRRLLQMEPRDVVDAIGTAEIDNGTSGNKKLAKFILKVLKENHLLTTKDIMTMDSWELCVE